MLQSMKLLFYSAILVIISSCNVYTSEPRDFINENGLIQNGKIVVNSTDKINTSYCLYNQELDTEELIPIDDGEYQKLEYVLYKSIQNIQLSLNSKSDELNCDFSVKDIQSLKSDDLKVLLDLGVDILSRHSRN